MKLTLNGIKNVLQGRVLALLSNNIPDSTAPNSLHGNNLAVHGFAEMSC